MPQRSLHLFPYGDQPLFIPFAQDLDRSLLETEVIQSDAGQLGDPERGIEQGEDDGLIAVALGRGHVYGAQQLADLCLDEGGDHLPRSLRYLQPVEGVGTHQALGGQPGPERPDGAQVAVYGMAGEPLVLGFGETVAAEAPLMQQVEDEGPDLRGPDEGGVPGQPLGAEEPLQIGYAAHHYGYGPFALALGLGEEPVALEQPFQVRG